jgi:SAM-dependent methyltransferase
MLKKISSFKNPRVLWLSVYSCLAFLVLFQARWAMTATYGFDESCYLEYLHKFLNEPFPSCYSKSLFWGVALTWWPIGLFAKLSSKLFNIPFTELALPLIGLFSFVQWVASLFILDKTVILAAEKEGRTEVWPSYWTFLALLTLPVTNYVFRWNFFSHAGELLLVSLTFYFLVSERTKLALFFAAWTFATRLNDIPIVFVVLCSIWDRFNQKHITKKYKQILIMIAVVCFLPVFYKFWRICFVTGYNGFFLSDVIKAVSWDGIKKGILNPYHGLVWHDFMWFCSILYLATQLKKLSKTQIAIWLWQMVLFGIHVSQFIFWGYSENRLFIGSYIGLFFNLALYWPKMSALARRFCATCVGLTAFWRTWYFVAATAPGLKYWSEYTGQKDQPFIIATVQMLMRPGKTLEITTGLSPLGFSLFSWGKSSAHFARYSDFSKYSLNGFSLIALSVFTVGSLLIFAASVISLFKFRKAEVDDVSNISNIQRKIKTKPALKYFYEACYKKYEECLRLCPDGGVVLEIGSGGGFAKEKIPNLVTSDVIPYPNVDKVVDATQLDFKDDSLSAIFLLNTFHHIPDVEKFLKEADRCLKPGGRILIIDQHIGWISKIILKYFHHEPFDPNTDKWSFNSTGPLSGANGALAWIVFQRDKKRLETLFDRLRMLTYRSHTPLLYWISGGLKSWSLAPKALIPFWLHFEKILLQISEDFGSFTDVELIKTERGV